LIAVCTAIFMLLLDITVVNVALPSIQRDLHSSFADLQWVVDAYSLTLAAFMLTAGSLADRFGRRRVFTFGLVVFTFSSAVCGLSSTPLTLNLARAAQGVGGAMMFATSLALLASAFHGRERGMAFGIYGAVVGAAVAIGPLVGGIITAGIGWQWIFFVNLPIGVAAVALTRARVTESRDPAATGVDWAGLVTFSASLFALVYALQQGNGSGWGSTKIVALLCASAALLAAFLLVELRSRRPMLDLSLFRRPAFAGANIAAFAVSSSMFAMFLYLTLYIQDVLGYGALQAGLRFLPITVISFFAAPLSGRLSVRVPVRLLLGGGLLLVGGGLLAMTAVDASSGWTVLVPGFLLAGAGVGTINPPLASTAVGVVHHSRSGMASGINNTFRQVGIVTGIAGLGAVFTHEVTRNTLSGLAAARQSHAVQSVAHGQLPALLQSGAVARIFPALPPAARAALEHSWRVGFTDAFTTILMIASAVAFVGAVCAFALIRSSDFVGSVEPVGADAPGRVPVAAAQS
jgi:EmrB/QacA subfamily drug resistance transporter